MSALESSIDDLYRRSPDEFVAARKALAKSLAGEDAQRVKQLSKPTVVAWAANQVYWQRRSTYDRLLKSGKSLRTTQIGALNGRSVDVRSAVEDHRASVAQAVADASQLASEFGVHPNVDELSRTFEALSLGTGQTEPAGRLIKALQPAGFEALAGIVVKAPVRAAAPVVAAKSGDGESSRRAVLEQQARERKEADDARRKAEAIAQAKDTVAQARAAEDRAKSEWERRQRDRDEAEQALARLQDL
jgi:hypothetical protein